MVKAAITKIQIDALELMAEGELAWHWPKGHWALGNEPHGERGFPLRYVRDKTMSVLTS